MRNRKALVIGGAGFLGSHIADSLSEAGYIVTVFDLKESPYLRSDQEQVVGDMMNETTLDHIIKGHQIVYNIAGISDIDECDKRPVDTIRYNVLGTALMLDACVKNKVGKFIFASSAYVYSDAGSFYRISKQASEFLVDGYQKKYGLPYVILRYGSLYGERSDRRNSIYRLIEDALTKHKIVYGGDGSERREFIHVKDAADLSVEVLDPAYENQNMFLTGEKSMKYSELLDMIREILHDKIDVEYIPKQSGTHYKLSPYTFNPKFARKMTGKTHVDLGQGILNVISEIHQSLHPEVQEKFGMLIKDKKG